MTRQRFTFIELLVVIGIMSILAALLLPALHRAKSAARQVACQSNLKQISLGILFYVEDYRTYPIGDYSAPDGNFRWERDLVKWDYYPNKSTDSLNYNPKQSNKAEMFCPEYRQVLTMTEGIVSRGKLSYACIKTGWITGAMGKYTYNNVKKNYVRQNKNIYPADKIMLIDHQKSRFFDDNQVTNTGRGRVAFPHLNHTNALFTDGHVEGKHLKEFLRFSSHGTWFKGYFDVTKKPIN